MTHKIYAIGIKETSEIIINEFFNSVGSVNWQKIQTGVYQGIRVGAFPISKTYIPCFGDWQGEASPYMPISGGGVGVVGYYGLYLSAGDLIGLEIFDSNWQAIDLKDLMGESFLHLPKIEVYP